MTDQATGTTTARAGEALPASDSSGLFARKSTGLVREVGAGQAILLNFISGLPPIGVAFGVFFALTGFPGGNLLLGIAFTVPLTLAFCYTFGLTSAVIPRTGGDYTLVGRILHPRLGVISSCCMLVATFLAMGGLVLALTTQAVAPGLQTVGYVANSKSLISAGQTVATSHAWQIGIGLFMVLVCALVVIAGWTVLKRALTWMVALAVGGLVLAAIIDLFVSRGNFIGTFNTFAHHYTGLRDTYHATINDALHAKLPVNSGFSAKNSFPLVGVMASFSLYAYTTAFMAGEIRQASSTKTGHRMAIGGLLSLAVLAIVVVLFFKGWGQSFLAASYSNGLPKGITATPTYVFLSSALVGNSIYAALLGITFALTFFAIGITLYIWSSRIMFAWAFDGILPYAVTKVNRRGAPTVATWISAVFFAGATLYAILATSFIREVVYATLVQMVAMGLLMGLAAIALPYRRAALYRASSSARRFLGIPVVVIAGASAIAAAGLIFYLYLHYSYFGLAHVSGLLILLFGTVAFGIIWYSVAAFVRKRQGVDLGRVYAEIPPE